jgi:hypothetical protein
MKPKYGVKKSKVYRNGGAVLPAARIDGNEFVKAAQAVGLPTTRASLNRIVDLVNRGMSVKQAATQLASASRSRMRGTNERQMRA